MRPTRLALEPDTVVRLLVWLRFVAAVLLLLAFGLSEAAYGHAAPVFWLLAILLLGFNLAVVWRLRGDREPAEHPTAGQAGIHMGVDSLALFVLFWQTGGAANPFVSLFLVPVALASVALTIRYAAMITALCLAAYAVLLARYLDTFGNQPAIADFERHVIGMWINFVLAAVLLCACLLMLASMLRKRERELAAQRERLLRDDAIVSVAIAAAGAAHALNTPLASIMVAAESLGDHPRLPIDAHEDLATIREQTELCATHLRRLVVACDRDRQGTRVLADYAGEIMRRWQTRRPEIEGRVYGVDDLPAYALRDDPALSQALLNLLDNAADASLAAHSHTVTVDWACAQTPRPSLALTIDDDGAVGEPDAVNRDLAATTKPHGLGLGLTLARASIARLGGHLTLSRSPDGGTRTAVWLPLTALTDETGDAHAATAG